MLVHPSLSTGQEPQDAFDDEVGDEPAHAALGYSVVDVRGFEEVGNEAVNYSV